MQRRASVEDMHSGPNRRIQHDDVPHVILGTSAIPDGVGTKRQGVKLFGRAVLALALLGALGYAALDLYHESTGSEAAANFDQAQSDIPN